MSTFKEYLEKTAAQSKKETDEKLKIGKTKPKFKKPTRENQALNNTKIVGGDEVVNESDENFIDLKRKLKDILEEEMVAVNSEDRDDYYYGIFKEEFDNIIDKFLNAVHTWANENHLT